MKKDFVAVIFFIICSVTVRRSTQNLPRAYAEELDSSGQTHPFWYPRENPNPPRTVNWIRTCMSEYHTIVGCARRYFNPFEAARGQIIYVDSRCCSVLNKYERVCSSKSRRFESLLYSFHWMKDSCAHPHTRRRPPPASSPSPTPPKSPTPGPPKSPPPGPPESPTPTPPKSPSPTPPSSPAPTSPPDNQTSSMYDPPEALPLPLVYGGNFELGCWSASGATSKCWPGKGNVVEHCCILTRYIGMYCDGFSNPLYDGPEENCCLNYKDGSNDCQLVTPRYYDQN